MSDKQPTTRRELLQYLRERSKIQNCEHTVPIVQRINPKLLQPWWWKFVPVWLDRKLGITSRCCTKISKNAQLTYAEWLDRQSRAVQKKIVGDDYIEMRSEIAVYWAQVQSVPKEDRKLVGYEVFHEIIGDLLTEQEKATALGIVEQADTY